MARSATLAHLPWRISVTASKADAIANHCFYMIAMGKWLPGTRLPSVRQLESDWSVNRQTILKAYSSLAARGLVCHKPNGSYYVAEPQPRRDFARDRIEIENLHAEISQKIRSETDLSPVAVLRMLARITESELREHPEVAFVECSRSQAEDHAREIMERLHIPVFPLTLEEITGRNLRIPPHIKTVLTTSFHVDELASLRDKNIEVAALPIEIAPELVAELESIGRRVVFLEADTDLARRTASDAIWMMGIKDPSVEVVSDIGDFLADFVESCRADSVDTLFLIAQKEWEYLDPRWHGHYAIRPISCKLTGAAWPMIGDALRIPFGASV